MTDSTTIRVALLDGENLRRGGIELVDEWSAGFPSDGDDGTKASGPRRLWVDINNPTQEAIEPLLEERFGFHELAAEDAVSSETLPKFDRFQNVDFFVFRAVDIDLVEHVCITHKLAAFLGAGLLVTVHWGMQERIDEVWQRLPGDRRLLANGNDFLLYAIVDAMVDAHFPLLDEIDNRIDELQEAIFTRTNNRQLDDLLHMKRDLNQMRRQIFPQRDLLNQISRGDAQFVSRDHLIYFRDIYDHMFRISETIDLQRDAMAGTMDAYLSVIANRTNEIMRMLTVFSAIMLPLSLIAGIYGMNFDHMPELHWRFGYAFALGIMAAVAIVMLVYFKRKGWIGGAADGIRPHRRARPSPLRNLQRD